MKIIILIFITIFNLLANSYVEPIHLDGKTYQPIGYLVKTGNSMYQWVIAYDLDFDKRIEYAKSIDEESLTDMGVLFNFEFYNDETTEVEAVKIIDCNYLKFTNPNDTSIVYNYEILGFFFKDENDKEFYVSSNENFLGELKALTGTPLQTTWNVYNAVPYKDNYDISINPTTCGITITYKGE